MPGRSARSVNRMSRGTVVFALGATIVCLLPSIVAAQPGDPPAGRQVDDPAVVEGLAWHLDRIGAARAWESGVGTGVVVAVIDSGVDATHPDLEHQVIRSVSCIGADGDPDRCRVEDPGTGAETHGTHVAGIIAARADDRIGVAGVAPRTQLLVVRVLETSCPSAEGCRPTGDTDDVAAGVRWAAEAGADVINMSLNAQGVEGDLSDALHAAWAAGAVPVLAAGPRSGAAAFFDQPASLLVTATDRSGDLTDGAPFLDADAPAVAAPGGSDGDTPLTCQVGGSPAGVLSTAARTEGDRSGYTCLSGTSMAAAVVSGSLAVLLSMGHRPQDAVDRLLVTARPGPGLGAGEIDLAAATAEPHPPGVEAVQDPFDTGAPTAEVTGATGGPFNGAAPAPTAQRPDRLILVLAALAIILLGDLVLRVHSRRRREIRPGRERSNR